MPLSVYHNGTFFKFQASISVPELYRILRIRKSAFPSIFPINSIADDDVNELTESLYPLTDPNEPIPDGIYAIVTTDSGVNSSLRLQNAAQTVAELRNRGSRETPATNDPSFQKWYKHQFGRDFGSIKFYKRLSPRRYDQDAGDATDCETTVASESAASDETILRKPKKEKKHDYSDVSDSDDSQVDKHTNQSESSKNDRIQEFAKEIEEGNTDNDDENSTKSESSRTNQKESIPSDSDDEITHLPKLPKKFGEKQNYTKYSSSMRSKVKKSQKSDSASNSESSEDSDESNRKRNISGKSVKKSKAKTFPYSKEDRQFDNDLNSGIRAMSAATAIKIHSRYFKYNTILSLKIDNALKRVEIITKELRQLQQHCSSNHSQRTRILQGQILSLLHAVWRTAWAKFSPKMRRCGQMKLRNDTGAEYSVTQTIQAEYALNRLNMWRRITESDNRGCRNDGASLIKSSNLMNGAPTLLYRRNPYTPHVYLTAGSVVLGSNYDDDAAAAAEQDLIRHIRVAFLDAAVRDKVCKTSDLDVVLTNVVDYFQTLEVDDDSSTQISPQRWNYLVAKLRREFWLDKVPEGALDLMDQWDKKRRMRRSNGDESCLASGGNCPNEQANNARKLKNRVRWNDDEYF
ncbi:hypothetical protein HK100_006224 [Physocladia obscura]|uniref:Uncharacterized protein n=1 Tax=Physocladia obscura TaxID=109957 RepID=A0AAD5SS33_9FUNG|nr:hypothetical protein HK100_006224 [Physocladia obscura]